jgi:sulfate transport system permease protein
LFQEYNLPGSFAVASVLTLLAILTLIVKSQLDHKIPSLGPVAEPGSTGARR